MAEHTLTLLHISDLHMRAGEKPAWRRRRVLGDAWEKNLDVLRAEGPYDLVCFTGDAAFAGKPSEYEQATEFFQAVLDKLGLGWDRFFTVPGNHDIDRTIAKPNWRRLRDKLPQANRSQIASWLTGGRAPLGFKDREREQILARQAAYRQWIRDLGRPDLDPASSPHGLLGYRQTLSLPGLPFPLHILGLDSSWMCGDDNDSGKLWLTDEQVMRLATDPAGDPLKGFRLILVHHPLEDLADASDARRLLAERVDLILRGHLHEPEAQTWADPERTLRQIVAGCLYEHDRYPNACERIRITFDDQGRPIRYDLRFRGWSTRGRWYDDNSLYEGTVDGRLTIWVSGTPSDPQPDPRAAKVFVGREPELAELEKSLLQGGPVQPVAICAVQGMAGVGKSYLVTYFVHRYQEHFPGGIWKITLDADGLDVNADSLLRELTTRLQLSPALAGLAERVRSRLLINRSLLHLENVDTKPLAKAAAELISQVLGCPVIVSGRYKGLGESLGWTQVTVRSFDEKTALDQLRKEVRWTEKRADYRRLVSAVGRLPLAIHLAAGYLKAGYSVDGFLSKLNHTGLNLPSADVAESAITKQEARRVISSTFNLSLDALKSQLGTEAGRLMEGFIKLGYAPSMGFEAGLGVAIAELSALEFEMLVVAAQGLSLIEVMPQSSRRGRFYQLNPLLMDVLRRKSGKETEERAFRSLTEWIRSRLPELKTGLEEIESEAGAITSDLSETADADSDKSLQSRGLHFKRFP